MRQIDGAKQEWKLDVLSKHSLADGFGENWNGSYLDACFENVFMGLGPCFHHFFAVVLFQAN